MDNGSSRVAKFKKNLEIKDDDAVHIETAPTVTDPSFIKGK